MRLLNVVLIILTIAFFSILSGCDTNDEPGIASENEVNTFIFNAGLDDLIIIKTSCLKYL